MRNAISAHEAWSAIVLVFAVGCGKPDSDAHARDAAMSTADSAVSMTDSAARVDARDARIHREADVEEPPESGPEGCPEDEPPDCLDVCGGASVLDDCGVCNGDNRSMDCMGVCDGHAVEDCTGTCNGDAKRDCAGTCNGNAKPDCAGRCDGPDHGILYHVDRDGDGLGAAGDDVAYACAGQPIPPGFSVKNTDCDDRVYGCREDCKACRTSLDLFFKTKLSAADTVLRGMVFDQRGFAGIGDVDRNGVPDLIHGAAVLLLSPQGKVLQVRRISPSELAADVHVDSLGKAVAAVGDVDGDGTPDVALGEPGYPTTSGRIWLLRFKDRAASLLARSATVASTSICTSSWCPQGADDYGAYLAAVDLDGDRRLELVAASQREWMTRPEDGRTAHETGRIEFWTLNADGSFTARGSSIDALAAPYTSSQFCERAALLSPGDIDRDGVGDLVVGVCASVSRLWTLLLTRDGAIKPANGAVRTLFEQPGALAALAKLDSPDDPILLARPSALYSNDPPVSMRFLALALASSGVARRVDRGQNGLRMFGVKPAEEDRLGAALTVLGDIDADGLAEVAMLAPGDDTAGPDAGAIYIFGLGADCGRASKYGDCDGVRANGCETPLISAEHCGACGNSCLDRERASSGSCRETAQGAQCVLECTAGFSDCNGDASDGCETSTSHLPNVRRLICPDPVILECQPGWGDCDGDINNGCETDTRSSIEHCGSCAPCPEDAGRGYAPVCSAGVCAMGPSCARGRGDAPGGQPDCDLCGFPAQVEGFPYGPPRRVCTANERCTLARGYDGSNYVDIAVCQPKRQCPLGRADCNQDGDCDDPGDDVTSEFRCGTCYDHCAAWSYRHYCTLNADASGYQCSY